MEEDDNEAPKLEHPWKESIHAFSPLPNSMDCPFTLQCISTSPMAAKGESNSNQNVNSRLCFRGDGKTVEN